MSTAHRPTWTPAQGKDIKSGSRQFSARDIASQTKLKFRQSGQDSTGEVSKRDLRAELLAAEQEARDKKRKAEGKPVIESPASTSAIEAGEDEATKRRKLLQQALELDKDDDDDDDEDSDEDMADGGEKKNGNKPSDEDEDDDDDDESDDEDDTAELLRELEKIKRERAEEKERLEREKAENSAVAREEEIATSNPLMNLAAALGQQKGSVSSAGFSVKKRWDGDLVFKNQAVNDDKPSGEFINDLLRTEFHKKFMSKFIK